MKCSFAPHVAFVAGLVLAGVAHAQGSASSASSSPTPAAPATEGAPPSGYAWAGAWVSNDYAGGYAGALRTFNADNSLYDSGFAVRGDISGGEYSYSAPGFLDRNVSLVDADVMVGYRKRAGAGTLSGYVGLAYIDHDNPDPAARPRGSKTGLALRGEYQITPDSRTEIHLQARYATPFQTWSGSGRVLWKVSDRVSLGPEVSLTRNSRHREVSVGPHMKLRTGAGELGFSAGYRHPTKSGAADGYYAAAYLAAPFR
ncbi:cellulose biosynthesis protein BcsS [uncultured Phenylobacterium sp.]|uniref:cellulose biosynthesis protein BcsS n=1 Tax=uncultured Phenylobacterium sp. TaxID=349273 RepID=UPI0025CC08AF|nr:cellulose biosynthesis protein BcsS [uncultured Phenylobacterium sp.]